MIEVNLYLWIGIITALVFSVVYISHALKRIKKLEAIFIFSMQNVAEDVTALEDKITSLQEDQGDVNDKFDTLQEWVQDKYNK